MTDIEIEKFAIHVCMVSEQPTPNLTPVLDERFRPDKVVFLVTDDMRERAGWLAGVIKTYGVDVIERPIPDAWDVESVRDIVGDLLLEFGDSGIALNVTGGTKPMAIAAFGVFSEFGKPVFYIHPEHDRLVWVNEKRFGFDLQDRVRIENFLAAHGYRTFNGVDRKPVMSGWRKVTAEIIRKIDVFGRPMGVVNALAGSAENKMGLLSMPIDHRARYNNSFAELLGIFSNAGLLEEADGDRLRFPDEDSRFFVNGGWLEQHVKDALDSLRAELGIHDIAQGIEICSSKNCTVKNEIDVAFLANNRLHVIECKTRRFDADESHGKDTLYKLDSLSAVGGTRARAMLVSFRDLPEADSRRAEELGIKAIVGTDIRNIRIRIKEWVLGKNGKQK